MNPLFSIIIPVYKVDEYINRCVGSIITQDFQDFEIILVDDGSPDECPSICEQWGKRDSRITVIHKNNGGLSSARNCGLMHAKGVYVIFVDSDDYWRNSHGLFEIADRIHLYGEDVILFEGVCKDAKSGIETLFRGQYDLNLINEKNKQKTINYLSAKGKFPGSAWIYAVKKNLIDKCEIRFPENVTGEDYFWNSQLLYHSRSIGAVNNNLYVYVTQRNGSITSQARLSGVLGIHYAISNWVHLNAWYENKGITQYLAYAYLVSLYNYGSLNEKEKKTAKQLLDAHRRILWYSKNTYFRVFYLLLFVCNYNILSKMLYFRRNKTL